MAVSLVTLPLLLNVAVRDAEPEETSSRKQVQLIISIG